MESFCPQIKLIDRYTDLSHLYPLNWDVEINSIPYYVAHVPGYVHTIKGWSDAIDLWAWPRSESPTYENLIEYNCDSPVDWGIRFEPKKKIHYKHGETEVWENEGTVITRNGKDFYRVPGVQNYSVPKALTLIEEIQEHPLEFNTIDFVKREILGRKIWYRSQPAIITDYIDKSCHALIVPEDEKYFIIPPEFSGNDLWTNDREHTIKVDLLTDKHIWWWRD